MKSKGIILSIEKIATYVKTSEIGVRLRSGTHHIVARIPENLQLKIGQEFEANLVSLDNSGDYAAISFETK